MRNVNFKVYSLFNKMYSLLINKLIVKLKTANTLKEYMLYLYKIYSIVAYN